MKDQHLPKPMFLTVLDDVLDVLPECMQVVLGYKMVQTNEIDNSDI